MGNEFLFQLLLVSLFFVPWFRRRKFFLLRYLLSTAIYCLLSVFIKIPMPYYYLIIFTLYCISVYLSFNVNLGEALYFSVNTYCVQFMISTLSYALSFLLSYGGWHKIPYYAVSAVVTAAVLLPVYFFYTRKMLKKDKIMFNSVIVFCVSAVFLAVAVFVSYYMQKMSTPEQKALRILLRVFFFMFGAAVFLVNMLNQHSTDIEQEKKVLCLLLQKDKEYYERAKMNADRLNIKYHDLKQLLNKGVITEDYLGELGFTDCGIATGNRALDIVLTEKSLICKKESIKFICSADGKLLKGLKPYHIYSLFGNALDNAIESLKNTNDKDKREITLNVSRIKEMCVINLDNFFSGDLNIKNGEIQTSKSDYDNHGYGIKSMKDIAAHYGGEVNISLNDEIFSLMIILPLGEADKSGNEM